jgi:hypothetical protein
MTHGENEEVTQILLAKLQRERHFKGLNMNWKIILKLILVR